jgi:hypothetical protein
MYSGVVVVVAVVIDTSFARVVIIDLFRYILSTLLTMFPILGKNCIL